MCAEYFAVAWVLRRIVWNFVAYAFETFLTYNAFKDILNEWIPIIKQWFYFCLGYSIIGFCGAVGAITGFLPILWVYLVYLLVTWGINAYQMYLRVKAILGLEDTIKTACDTVGVFMNLGNCDDLFGKIKEYTYGGAAAVLLLQGTTLLCTGILIRREYLKTGFLFTSMFSSAEEIERRKEKMADRKAGRKEKKAAKHEHALGKEGHAVYEGRMERRRMRAAQEEEGEAIPMKRMEGRQRGLMESSGEEEDLDDTFELPRRSQRLQEESEEELYDPPEELAASIWIGGGVITEFGFG
ncbi:hypothetical protein BCR35DRAFT_328507 [Leucosporidium creatinivorum]|uniref:Uncharacterized protein n=1 Tax=Leucosporidium creatinivorum TaxID=106004 RepID=A0A1Y2G1G4_9BASI|nr:hypothetical protein BCR35DRAFT_328507 [Leucosporidium creatinivorum]